MNSRREKAFSEVWKEFTLFTYLKEYVVIFQ